MRVSRWFASAALAVTMLVGWIAPVMAQQAVAPVATVVISPVERTLKDVSWLLESVNQGQLVGFLSIMGDAYTEGLDKSKPLGVLLTLENGMPKPLVCLPVSDHKVFFEQLAKANLQADDLGNGMYEFAVGPQVIVAKVSDGWIYVGQNEDAVSAVPANPADLFGDYHKRYNVTVKIDVQQVPEELKSAAIENMKQGFESAMRQQSAGQTEEQQAAAREMGEVQIAQLVEMINSTQQVILGFLIDSSKQQVHVDGAVQYMSGSKLAKQMDAQSKLKSDFTSLILPSSAVEFRVTSLATNEEDKKVAKQSLRNTLAQAKSQLDNSNAPEEIATLIKQFIDGFADVFEKTIDEGVIDGASSVSVANDKLRIVSGARIADGHAVEKQLKDLVAGLPKKDAVKVEFDIAKHNGFNLHRVTAAIPDANAEAKAAFGDSLQFYIAGGDKAVLVCLDPSGDAGIKAAIDGLQAKKSVDVSPVYGVVRLTSLLRFAQSIKPNPVLENVIGTLGQFSGKDQITVNSTVLPRGMVTRLTIDEGILRAAGSAAMAGQQNAGF